MKIETVTIHNFRSIPEATFKLDDYSLIVGRNNAGKSNVIDALRVFYEKDGFKYKAERDRPKLKTSDKESWIDVEYRLSKAEFESLKPEYRLPGMCLKVRKYLQTQQKGADGKQKSGIYGYTEAGIADTHFYGAQNVQQGKLGDLIYIQAASSLNDHTKLSGPSELRDLLSMIVSSLVKSSPMLQELNDYIERAGSEIQHEQTKDGHSISNLVDELNTEIADWNTETEFRFNQVTGPDFVKNIARFIYKDMLLNEQDNEISPDQFGQGFQRHLIYTIIKLTAKYDTASKPASDSEFHPDLNLILFEEPEAFLHPSQQKVLCRSLQELAEGPGMQAIVTTHSPQFVSLSTEKIPSIVRLSRDEGRTLCYQTDRKTLDSIFAKNLEINEVVKGTNMAANEDDYTVEMEVVKHFLWLGPERCDLFFAEHVLLVEGPTEVVLCNYLMDNQLLPVPSGGLCVVDCFGKLNLHRFMNLLGALGIKHSVLFDADDGKPPHEDVRKLILSSRNEFTHSVQTFETDLEGYLEIPRTSTRRKPQHLMYCIQSGVLKKERLEKCAEFLNDLINTPNVTKLGDGKWDIPNAIDEHGSGDHMRAEI